MPRRLFCDWTGLLGPTGIDWSAAIGGTFWAAHPDGWTGLDFYGSPRFSPRPVVPAKMVKYDKVTVHFTGDREPMVVE
jgi:hypothetical protein